MKKRVAISLGAVALIVVVAHKFLDAPTEGGASTIRAMELGKEGDTGVRQKMSGFVTGLEGLPRSLQGTEVDGDLEVDADGHLKITSGIRRVFDYFLSTIGEESIDVIKARIKAYIRQKVPPMAAREAEQILDKYISYRIGLEGIQQAAPRPDGSFDLSALNQQIQSVKYLRLQYFSRDIIAAFFGDDDIYDGYTISRMSILQDKNISAVQRAKDLAALETTLPSSMRESIKVITQSQSLDSLEDDWKRRGGSVAELRQIRESVVGAEAADRLEALDADNLAWENRMSAWFAARESLLRNRSLSEEGREAQIEVMRKSGFSEGELARVQALERMHDRGERIGR